MRWWRCKGVEAGFVKVVRYRGGGKVHPGRGSDLEEAAGTRDCSKVVAKPHVESDRHCRWSARRWGWNNRVEQRWCH